MSAKSKSKGKGKAYAIDNDDSDIDFSTQGFEAHESDQEQLWNVIEIRGERKGMYLIQWDGTDENGKPWEDSWVAREDVTDDLVEVWKEKKRAEKKVKARKNSEKRERKRTGSSMTATTSRSRTDSKASTSTATTTRPSNRFSSTTSAGRTNSESLSTNRTSPTKKRRQSVVSEFNDSVADTGTTARKKRKVSIDAGPSSHNHDTSKRQTSQEEEETQYPSTEVTKHITAGTRTASKKKAQASAKSPNPAISDEDDERDEPLNDEENLNAGMRERQDELTPMSKEVQASNNVYLSQSNTDRINDRRPTPPRRTLMKSARDNTDSHIPSVSANKKRKGPPGTRVGDMIPAEREALDVAGPRSRKSSERPEASSMESEMVASPSKLRRGITSRMKGKESLKKSGSKVDSSARSYSPASGVVEKVTSNLNTDNLQNEPQIRVGSRSLPKSTHSTLSSPSQPLPNSNEQYAAASSEVNDDGFVFDNDTYNDPLPFSQDESPLVVEPETLLPDVQVVLAKQDAVEINSANFFRDERSQDDSGESEGAIIPQSQSQEQSQSHTDETRDAMLPDSNLAEHGSSTPRINELGNVAEDETMSSEAPASSLVSKQSAEAESIDHSQSITDPEISSSAKVHGRIPVVTPSKFKPYLPAPQKPLSTFPPPNFQSAKRKKSIMHSGNGVSTSSIESPVKDFDTEAQNDAGNGMELGSNQDETELSDDNDDDIDEEMPRSLDLRQRGLELAEVQRRKRLQRKPTPRIPLNDILAGAARAATRVRSEKSNTASSYNSSTPPPASGEVVPYMEDEDDDEARLRQFQEDYLDFDGNAGGNISGSGAGSVVDDTPQSITDEQLDSGLHASAPIEDEAFELADIESSLHNVISSDDPFISQRAGTPTTTTSQHEEMSIPYTPPRSRFKILGSPSKFAASLQTPSRQLNEAMGLLHGKSEEIELLRQQLAANEARRLEQDDSLAELQAENAVLKKTYEKHTISSTEFEEGSMTQLNEKYDELARDRDALEAEIKLLKMSRDDAVKQSEFLREMYGTASSFADEMKRENADLTERVKIAEGQVTTGLGLIRNQSAAMEQKLRTELDRQSVLLKVLSTKDLRTDDEVRRRAALEPELQNRIIELQDEIHDLETTQSNIVRQRNDLLVEKLELGGQLEGLQTQYKELSDSTVWLRVQVERYMARESHTMKCITKLNSSATDDTHTESSQDSNESDHGDNKVYICKWLTDHEGKRALSSCNLLFANVQDLKEHLFVDHRL